MTELKNSVGDALINLLSEFVIFLTDLLLLVGSKNAQKQQIDGILVLFNSTYEQLEGESLRHLMVSCTISSHAADLKCAHFSYCYQ